MPFCFRLAGALSAAVGLLAHGQMHHVDAPERVTRAVGVYEWTGDLSKPLAARFVPVSLFIDGHFEDAGLYLARPVPFALQPGDVYALEHAGEPEGLLDLDLAHRVVTGKALADDNPAGAWYAFGKFTPAAAPRPMDLHPSRHLSKIESSPGPNTPAGTKPPAEEKDSGESSGPHLDRRDGSTGATGSAGSSGNTGATGSTGSSSGGATPPAAPTSDNAGDDTDRPTLRRRDPAQDAARRRQAGSKGNTASVTAAGPALGDDPDRPILGHSSGEPTGTPELTGLPADLHQAVGVSDANHRDAHVFTRAWDSSTEQADTLAAMAAVAKTRVAEYLAANQLQPSSLPIPAEDTPATATGKATGPAPAPAAAVAPDDATGAPPKLQRGVPQQYKADKTPGKTAPAPAKSATPAAPSTTGSVTATPTPAAKRTSTAAHAAHRATAVGAPKAVPLRLLEENVSGFTLSYGGLPTFVYTAATAVQPAQPVQRAKPSSSVPGTAGPTAQITPVAYVTVVAQRLPTGELQVALSAVTDSGHLDRSPHLRLIDAVDPDDSHRASLLFELRAGSSRQFALYRLTSVHAEQTFSTASLE